MRLSLPFILSSFLAFSSALSIPRSATSTAIQNTTTTSSNTNSSNAQYTSTTLYQFPPGTWVENIAARYNGQLLVTLKSPTASLYLLDPTPNTTTASPILIHSFPSSNSLMGIVETSQYAPDNFFVVATNFSSSGSPIPYTSSIWRVDMTTFAYNNITGTISSPATISYMAPVPQAKFLNGLTLLSPNSSHILMADSLSGTVLNMDVSVGTSAFSSSSPLMLTNNSATQYMGINGIKVRSGQLFFTNTGEGILARQPIFANGTAMGDAQIAVRGLDGPDDFCLLGRMGFGEEGGTSALVAGAVGNVIYSANMANGSKEVVLGAEDLATVEGATSCVIGRGWGVMVDVGTGLETINERRVAYVTTNGGVQRPVGGTAEGGKVVAVYLGAADYTEEQIEEIEAVLVLVEGSGTEGEEMSGGVVEARGMAVVG